MKSSVLNFIRREPILVISALALHQRPGVPGLRSTFGTGTELLNNLRLMFSRLASHRCPNGHYLPPTLNVAAERELLCPECGARFYAPGAEELAFNSQGACRRCDGTGIVRTVDESTLVPDESLSIDEGAVAPWQTLMWSLMKDIAREMGVRTDVPFCELTERERDIVFHGPAVKKNIIYQNKTSGAAASAADASSLRERRRRSAGARRAGPGDICDGKTCRPVFRDRQVFTEFPEEKSAETGKNLRQFHMSGENLQKGLDFVPAMC